MPRLVMYGFSPSRAVEQLICRSTLRSGISLESKLHLRNSSTNRRVNTSVHYGQPKPSRKGYMPTSIALAGGGLVCYYLYGLYSKAEMWPKALRSDLRDAIKARRAEDYYTASVYFQRALDKTLSYPDAFGTFGANYKLMLSGIAIELGGAYESAFNKVLSSIQRTDMASSSSISSTNSTFDTNDAKSREARAFLRRAYDAYETAFVILTTPATGDLAWEHMLQTGERGKYLRTVSSQQLSTKRTPIQDRQPTLEEEHRVIEVASRLAHLAGELYTAYDLDVTDPGDLKSSPSEGPGDPSPGLLRANWNLGLGSGSSSHFIAHDKAGSIAAKDKFETLEYNLALWALEAARKFHSAPANGELSFKPMDGVDQGMGINPTPTHNSVLDRLSPRADRGAGMRAEYGYLLQHCGDVYARRGNIRGSLYLSNLAVKALVVPTTPNHPEPRQWANESSFTTNSPPAQVCQAAVILNNMASLIAFPPPGSNSSARARTHEDVTKDLKMARELLTVATRLLSQGGEAVVARAAPAAADKSMVKGIDNQTKKKEDGNKSHAYGRLTSGVVGPEGKNKEDDDDDDDDDLVLLTEAGKMCLQGLEAVEQNKAQVDALIGNLSRFAEERSREGETQGEQRMREKEGRD